jgi:hypothetical protein
MLKCTRFAGGTAHQRWLVGVSTGCVAASFDKTDNHDRDDDDDDDGEDGEEEEKDEEK